MRTFNPLAFEQFPYLNTKRLQLRPILASDAPALFGIQSDSLMYKYLSHKKPHENLEEAQKVIEAIEEAYQKQQMLCWAATIRDQPTIIGTCGYNYIEPDNLFAEFGGGLDPKYWGAGIALEAIKAILNYGFEGMNLQSIRSRFDSRNRSVRYLMQQLGFVKEGHFKQRFVTAEGGFGDMEVWTLFRGALL